MKKAIIFCPCRHDAFNDRVSSREPLRATKIPCERSSVGPRACEGGSIHRLSVTLATTGGSLLDFGRRVRGQQLPRSTGPHHLSEQRPPNACFSAFRGRHRWPGERTVRATIRQIHRVKFGPRVRASRGEPVHRAKSLGHGPPSHCSQHDPASLCFSIFLYLFFPSIVTTSLGFQQNDLMYCEKYTKPTFGRCGRAVWPTQEDKKAPPLIRVTDSLTAHHRDGI